MQINRNRISQLLKDFEFKTVLIEELGWERYSGEVKTEIREKGVDESEYLLTAIAEKRGMAVFQCSARTDGSIPNYATRRKIQREVAKFVHEHLIIYTDAAETTQIWQWVKREPGKPLACREHRYHREQSGESLIQKLETIAFSLDEEEDLTLIDVTWRVDMAFKEQVTKRFYDHFKTEHARFLEFLDGIPDQEMERWYASVMLNRLMFIYFIQKKGFLNDDPNYLRTKLEENKVALNPDLIGANGNNRYYPDLLCPLFFEGFAKPESERDAEAKRLLGKVPYLNGGIFQRHQLEELHVEDSRNGGERIQIPDAAFEGLFDFFDKYQWHLDERPLRNDNEINPDVLGYIFEKYINQKQMGAYYTKEDITEYISKNTVIPFLFDAARKECRIAFEGEASVWQLLRDDPDRYIYDSVKTGVELGLPQDIAEGIHDVSKRGPWNTTAPDEYANPTEIWREVIARRARYESIRAKLSNGEIDNINTLITYNLDIRQFAQDVIENYEGSDLLRAFWKAIEKVTILDPTCGSGAFLFAALNILEPLYEACLDRMQVFLDESEHSRKSTRTQRFRKFRKVLEDIDQHPNRRYFILKSIIINNLYGVDIMEEAIEICKLRLFLKMVAQIDDVGQIEPLPDIDFNIQAGNALVGYATYDEVERAVIGKINFGNIITRIKERAEDVEQLFNLFHQQQTDLGGVVRSDNKQALRNKLKVLEDELNQYLAGEYGVDPREESTYQNWRSSHKPFHWFIEFYGILKNGGFDVIIGNPPYVEYRKVRATYRVRRYITESCGDLYAFVMERSTELLARQGNLGMIIPVSIVSTDGFSDLRKHLLQEGSISWTVNFAERPSKLFTGAEKRLTIWLLANAGKEQMQLSLSNYKRWYAAERNTLFSTVVFVPNEDFSLVNTAIPKVHTNIEIEILNRLRNQKQLSTYFLRRSQYMVYYTRQLRYFIQIFDFIPRITDSEGNVIPPSELKAFYLASSPHKEAIMAVLNSNLFFWFLSVHSDVRNVNKREIEAFRFSLDEVDDAVLTKLRKLSADLMIDFQEHSRIVTNNYQRYGVLHIQTFQPRMSKPIIDKIDQVLAEHYDLTNEELDFIINYNIKYRMGLGSD